MNSLVVRAWSRQDDDRLTDILRTQLRADPAWPPRYAHELNLSDWLAKPADLGRWVCERHGKVVGHIGLGRLSDEIAQTFTAATGRGVECFAELCRTVVDQDVRRLGAASALTRKALKTSLLMNRVPAATVLTSRGLWLEQMLQTGWQRIGDVATRRAPGERLVLLLAPQKFIDAVPTDG